MFTHIFVELVPVSGEEQEFQQLCEKNSSRIDPVTHRVRQGFDIELVARDVRTPFAKLVPQPGKEEDFQLACVKYHQEVNPQTHFVRGGLEIKPAAENVEAYVEYLRDPNIPK